MLEIRHYITSDGRNIFLEWLRKLRDAKAKTAVVRRVNRIEQGNFGDHKHCQEGVWELRIDTGPGYRVYYAQSGETIILLLCGGDKRTQNADISKACENWRDWNHRSAKKQENKP